MVKRKRNDSSKEEKPVETPAKTIKSAPTASQTPDAAVTIQVVTGSYERVLHGFTAGFPASTLNAKDEVSDESDPSIQCVDTFLFEAHGSAIRCLALSPLPKATDSADAQKVFLASGSTDERIQLYSLAAAPPAVSDEYPSVPTLAGNKILENPRNRELGSLLHHSASITALDFPSRSKLLAAGEDNEISISKTRDWSVVSTIKAPHPKVQGRPSGDTAPPGAAPSGVNHFAVHPSMKLMLSVGKGEKCMRLWNLVTGKKAGVLNFGREILQSVKEGKWSSGEGRRLAWNAAGEEFAVAFEWGAVVFGVDSTPKCRLLPNPRSKIHQMKYVSFGDDEEKKDVLAVSTEDGRVIFYSTTTLRDTEEGDDSTIPHATPVAQVGGKQAGLPGRIKDFEVLSLEGQATEIRNDFLLVTGNSDGVVRVWKVNGKSLVPAKKSKGSKESKDTTSQTGKLLTTYETGNRITCLAAFVMLPAEDPSSLFDSADEESEEEEESESDEDDE
ncbi:putative 60S ribosome biogenesis protein Mak11 [Penicillium brasilianum]|uniref:Putative 60S ribosome biogenesis protein Mak11 n=1 Tax=Penicillium brasilianum TaxID=104259 RepID=A0A1S9RCK3_PENBI|nr:putative 60S ribosome biogenesis protein Mak11 [Penicillium brasilianum]